MIISKIAIIESKHITSYIYFNAFYLFKRELLMRIFNYFYLNIIAIFLVVECFHDYKHAILSSLFCP